MASLGVKAGDRVALLVGDGLESAILIHALMKIGAVLVPLNARLAPEEMLWQVRDSRPRAFLHDGANSDGVSAVARACPDIPRALVGDGAPEAQRFVALEPAAFTPAEPTRDALHAILYTSGTTGRPKGAMLSYGNHLANAAGFYRRLGAGPGDRWLLSLPLYHVGGLAILLRAVLFGGTVVFAGRFDEARYLGLMREHRITHVSVVAAMLSRLYEVASGADAFTSLRCVLLGGGPASEELLEASLARGIPVSPTYGLTECASQVATLAPGLLARQRGSVGTAIPGVTIRIAREDGGVAEVDEEGEICVAGGVVTAGYWNRPAETARALRDGWLHTGDRSRMNAAGALTVLARESDLIISGGENIYPAEIERVLLAHPDVLDAAVLGAPDERWGAVPVALAVRRPGTTIDEAALLDHCRALLARYKTPRSIRFVESLPRTSLGKLRRRDAARLPLRNDGL